MRANGSDPESKTTKVFFPQKTQFDGMRPALQGGQSLDQAKVVGCDQKTRKKPHGWRRSYPKRWTIPRFGIPISSQQPNVTMKLPTAIGNTIRCH